MCCFLFLCSSWFNCFDVFYCGGLVATAQKFIKHKELKNVATDECSKTTNYPREFRPGPIVGNFQMGVDGTGVSFFVVVWFVVVVVVVAAAVVVVVVVGGGGGGGVVVVVVVVDVVVVVVVVVMHAVNVKDHYFYLKYRRYHQL